MTLATVVFVNLTYDGVAHTLQLFQVLFEVVLLGIIVGIKPVLSLCQGVANLALVVGIDLVGQLFFVLNSVAHLVDVVLELVTSIDLFLKSFVLVSELFSISDHTLDFFLGKAAFIISD